MFPLEELPSFAEWGESLLEDEPLQNISSIEGARRWVDRVVAESRPLEVLRYVGLFLGTHPMRTPRNRRKKGGGLESECDDKFDPRIYRFLALADSVHDSHHKKFNQSPESIMKFMHMKGNDLPKGLLPHMLGREEDVVQFLQRRKTLKFEHDIVENPLHGADLAHFDVQKARVVTQNPKVDYLAATYRQAAASVHHMGLSSTRRTLCLPIYSILYSQESNPKLRRIQLAQILDLAARMRHFLGRSCVFQPDTYHPLMKFMLAIRFINKAFFDKFVIDRDFHVMKYEHEIRQAIAERGEELKTDWGMTLCDANIFDGTSIPDPLPVDSRATGWIFRHGIPGISPHNLRLEGLSSDEKVTISEYKHDERLHKLVRDRDQARDDFSTGKLNADLPGARPDSDSERPNPTLAEVSRLLNLKRAGDWGQVEACKRHGRVFLTADRLAALYAYHRGVSFLLLRIHDYSELQYDMIQYSCCLGRG